MDRKKADVKEKIRSMWEKEKNDFYEKVLDEFEVESGDVSPGVAQRLDEVEDELVEVLADWISTRISD